MIDNYHVIRLFIHWIVEINGIKSNLYYIAVDKSRIYGGWDTVYKSKKCGSCMLIKTIALLKSYQANHLLF